MLLNRISLLCLLFNFTIFAAFNTASDYFNAASQTYIIDNNVKSAKKYIADGLTAFPNDEKLKKLDSYIKEEEKKQDQNQQNQDQNQQNKDQQNKDQQNKDQNQQDKKDQEKKDDQKQENQQPKDQQSEQQQKEQEQQAQQNESKQDMKKEEAKRLLELYADDADSLNKPPKKAHGSKGKFQKDW